MSMSGDTSGSKNLEDHDVGQRHPSQRTFAADNFTMFIDRLQDAEGPAETLAHQGVRVGGRLGVGERHVFVFDAISQAQQGHGEVGVFGDGVNVVSAGLAHCRNAPGADRARHHADRAQHVESAALEVLAGDVFQSLPARPEIHPIANLRIARDGADFGIDEMRHQSRDRILRDDGVGVDADE